MKAMKKTMVALVAVLLVAACERPPYVDPTDVDGDHAASPRALVLNEGAWGNNNAELSLLDNRTGALTVDWFSSVNGRGLGDVAQDIVLYGSKAYVTVTFSNSLEVVDTATGLAQRVDLGDRQPRYIAADGGKLYITCYRPHSVVCVDTATLQVEATCPLGAYNPEGIALAGGRLYVASSFVQDENSNFLRDTLLYVVDPAMMTVTDSIPVGLNPQVVVAVDDRYVVVNYSGDYTPGSDGTAVVDVLDGSVSALGVCLSGMCVHDKCVYGYVRQGYGAGSSAEYYRVTPATLALAHLSLSPGNPYGISVDPANGDVYVATDGNYVATGDLYCYTAADSLRWKAGAGRLPKKVVFLPGE